MAEHLVKIPCHIVFILKLYSKFLLGLFHCPAYLQHAPLPEELCSSGNAADYQWSIGIMGLSPLRESLRGSLRAASLKKRRKYHYTRHLHHRKQPSPHDLHSKSGCYSSPEVARSLAGGLGVGSCVASQKRKDPQH